MAIPNLDEALEATRAATAGVDSIIAAFAMVKQQLADALANENISAETQAKIDEILSVNRAEAQRISDALGPPPTP